MEFNQIVSELIINIIYLLILIIGTLFVAFLKKIVGTEKLKNIKELAEVKEWYIKHAVLFVQQVYKDLDGDEKFNIAFSWVINLFEENSISISEDELKGMIESSLKELKKIYGEAWEEL